MEVKKGVSSAQQKIAIAFFVIILVSFYYLKNIYIPIFVSYFLSFLLNPVIRKMEKRGFGRIGPIILLLSFVFALMGAIIFLMAPRVMNQMKELFERMPAVMNILSDRFSPLSVQYLGIDIFTQWKEVVQNIIPKIAVLPAAEIMEGFFSGTLKALTTLLTVLLIPILTFYLLKDYYRINNALLNLVPRKHLAAVEEVMKRLSIVLGSLIRGQFLVCLLLALYYSFALGAVGVDMALLLGVFSGLMSLVPFVGPIVSIIFTLLFTLLGGGGLMQFAQVLGVYVLANLVDSTVLTPKIVGRQVGISPLLIILGVLAGGELLGFLGVLLALPLMAMGKVLGEFFLERYKASLYYNDAGELAGRQNISDKL